MNTMENAQHFSCMPLEDLRQGLGLTASQPSVLLLSTAAALETLTGTVLQDAISEHEAMSLAGSLSRKLKEGRLTCQLVELAMRRRTLSAVFTAEKDGSSIANVIKRVADAFLDASTASVLKSGADDSAAVAVAGADSDVEAKHAEEEGKIDGETLPSARETASTAAEAVPTTHDVESWQRRRDDIVTEKEITSILKLVNPAFSLQNDAIVLMLGLHREIISAMKAEHAKNSTESSETKDDDAVSDSTGGPGDIAAAGSAGVCALGAGWSWLPDSLQQRINTLAELLRSACVATTPHFLPATITVKVKILRENGSVASATSVSFARSDPFNEHLFTACKSMFVERKDLVFLHGAAVVEGANTPDELHLPPKAVVFGVTRSWWENARREEGRRGILTAGSRHDNTTSKSSKTGAESALKNIKAKAVSKAAEDSKAVPATPVELPAPAVTESQPPVKKASASALLARVNKSRLNNVEPAAKATAETKPSYRPVVAGASTKLPVLSPSKVAAMVHADAFSATNAGDAGPYQAQMFAAAAPGARRLIKTPAVGVRGAVDLSKISKLPDPSTKADFGKRFSAPLESVAAKLSATSSSLTKSVASPGKPSRQPIRKGRTVASDTDAPGRAIAGRRERSTSVSKTVGGKGASSPPQSRRQSVSKSIASGPQSPTLFSDLQKRQLNKKSPVVMAKESKEASPTPPRRLNASIGALHIPVHAARTLLDKSTEVLKPLNAAVASLNGLSSHLSGCVPAEGRDSSESAADEAASEISLKSVKEALVTAQESTKQLLAVVADIERQSRKKPAVAGESSPANRAPRGKGAAKGTTELPTAAAPRTIAGKMQDGGRRTLRVPREEKQPETLNRPAVDVFNIEEPAEDAVAPPAIASVIEPDAEGNLPDNDGTNAVAEHQFDNSSRQATLQASPAISTVADGTRMSSPVQEDAAAELATVKEAPAEADNSLHPGGQANSSTATVESKADDVAEAAEQYEFDF